MNTLLNIFLMTIVATIPFTCNALVADSQDTYPILDLQEEEDPWRVRLNELINASKNANTREDSIKLAHQAISASEEVIFVDLRIECDGMPGSWSNEFHGHFYQTTDQLHQKEKACLREVLYTIYDGIDEGEYPINHFNLATFEDITEGEFVEDFEDRYVHFEWADGDLQNDLFVDQFLDYIDNLSIDYRIHMNYLRCNETPITLFFIRNGSKENLDNKQHTTNNFSRQLSNLNILGSKYISQHSPYLNFKSESSSNSIYESLLCDYSVKGEGFVQWGDKNGPSFGGSLSGAASDNRGNSVHTKYEYHDDGRQRLSGGGEHTERTRERARDY